MNNFYFDYAAATPMSNTVLAAMQPYFTEKFHNPSALYIASQQVKDAIYSARTEVASVLGCKPSEVIFTAGGTESDNLAINGVMQKYHGKNCIVSAVEHDAVLAPANEYPHKIAPVKPDGSVDVSELEKLIDDDTVLISVMYANNEIGTIQPLREIAKLIQKVRVERQQKASSNIKYQILPIHFHTDAAQAANYLPLLVNSLGVDLMSLNGGKIYGPKQSGILYVKTGVSLAPQILGGGQERGVRSGSENVPAIIGFAAALKEAAGLRQTEADRLSKLRDNFIQYITHKIPHVSLNGPAGNRLANNIHITLPGYDNERLMMDLDERGIMVATGSACSASSDEPSHVLKAIGLSDDEARSSLRITFGRQTDEASVRNLADVLAELVASEKNKR